MFTFRTREGHAGAWTRCTTSIILAMGLVACGGGSSGGADSSLGATGSPGEPASLDAAEANRLVGAVAFQLALQPSPFLAAPVFADLTLERGRQAIRVADGGDGVLRLASEHLDAGSSTSPMAMPKAARVVDCPGGGRLSSLDAPGALFFDFDRCVVPDVGSGDTYLNGRGEIDAGTIQMDVELRIGGQRMQFQLDNLVVNDRGRRCDARVTLASGSMSSEGPDGTMLAAWTNVVSDMRPDGRVCTWQVDGRFASNGVTLLDSGATLPPVRHDVSIRTLELLRYLGDGGVRFPFAGTVLIQPQPSGAEVQVRFTDGGAFFRFPGGGEETFVSQAEMLERVRSAE